MPHLNRIAVSVPNALKQYIEQRVSEGSQYASESDYIRQLVREDRARAREAAEIRTAVAEGIAEADAGKVKPADDVLATLGKKAEARKS